MSCFLFFRSAPRIIFISFLSFLFSPACLAGESLFLENGEATARGADAGFLIDTPTRLKIDLAGSWNYAVDGGASGMVKVPSAYTFQGRVSFERKFEVTGEQLANYAFSCVVLGANYTCEIYINGEFLSFHAGGYTTFVQPIPKNLLQSGGGNSIRMVVNNELDPRKTLPVNPQSWGWKNYGGILRDVYILATPPLWISDASVASEIGESGAARLTVRAQVDGAEGDGIGFSFELVEKISGTSVGRTAVVPVVRGAGAWQAVGATLALPNPKLWSPENPDLYIVKCFLSRGTGKESTVADEFDIVTGIRRIAIVSGHMLLNGKRLVLRGVIWNEDHPSWGGALTYEQRERDIALIKNLGANAVRFINHPPHPYMMNLCDRYGLMAMEELPVSSVPAVILADESFAEKAGVALREMVLRDRTHPSLLAWGIGDEFESTSPATRPFVEGLVRLARSLDDRPLYYGTRSVGNDQCTDLVDIAAVDLVGGDVKGFRAALEEWKARHRSQPVIVAKFGSEVRHDNRNGYADPLSQEAQARYFLQRTDVARSLEYDGTIVWAFNDWRGGRPALTVHSGNPWMHTMGLVSAGREKRLAYDAVRAAFHGEKFAALPMGNHASSAPIIYVLAGFVVLIGTAYLYNASRRFRECVNRSLLNSYNFFADIRDHHAVSLGHTAVLGVTVSLATALVLSSILFHFRDSIVLDNLLTYVLVVDPVKEAVVRLIWNPLLFIAVCSIVLCIALLLLAGVVHSLRFVFRNRIFAYHATTVTIWAAPPLLAFVPVGMILYRVMESPAYVIPSLVFVGAVFFWVFLRLLKGITIIFDARRLKVYTLGGIVVLAACALLLVYYDYSQSASLYLPYLYHTMAGAQ